MTSYRCSLKNNEGLTIFLHKSLERVTTKIKCVNKKFLMIIIKCDTPLLLVNLHAPSTSDIRTKTLFFNKLANKIKNIFNNNRYNPLRNMKIIIGGDFNLKIRGIKKISSHKDYLTSLTNLLNTEIIDAYEYINPHCLNPTYISYSKRKQTNNLNTNTKKLKDSILDYFYIDIKLKNKIHACNLLTNNYYNSDHEPLSLKITLNNFNANYPIHKHIFQERLKTRAIDHKQLKNILSTNAVKPLTNFKKELLSNSNPTIIEVNNILTKFTKNLYLELKKHLEVTKSPSNKRDKFKYIHHPEIVKLKRERKKWKKKKNNQKLINKLTANPDYEITPLEQVLIKNNFILLKLPPHKDILTFSDLLIIKDELNIKLSILTKNINKIILKMRIKNENKFLKKLNNNGDKQNKNFFNFIKNLNNNNSEINYLSKTSNGKTIYFDTNSSMIMHMHDTWQEVFKYTGFGSFGLPISYKQYPYPKINKPNDNITLTEVTKAIQNSNSYSSPGMSNIGAEIYKHGPTQTPQVLLQLFKTIWKLEQIPLTWKKAKMIMFQKKEKVSNALDFRPITLLDTEYKLYTSILNHKLNQQLEENDVISDLQFGFRKNRTTNMAHRLFHNIIEHSKIHNKNLFIIYIDFQKAFDSVEHWAIEEALEMAGISTKLSKNIMSLYDNLVSEIITTFGSIEIFINKGVRQGDGLSTTIFITFINSPP